MSAEPVVTLRGVHARRGERDVLRGVDLDVHAGEVLVVVGPSGAGKTTLLRTLNYLSPFSAGTVAIAGHALRPGMCERVDAAALRAVRTRVGMVFQSLHLFPHLTALGNVVEAPRRVLGLDVASAATRGRALLARVGLAQRADAYPQALSGGEQQRVAIARALAMEPAVLLLDEPTSALDPQLVGELLAVIADLAGGGQTMLIVTHDVGFARRVARRVAVLVDGRIVETGAAGEVLVRPRTPEARALLGLNGGVVETGREA